MDGRIRQVARMWMERPWVRAMVDNAVSAGITLGAKAPVHAYLEIGAARLPRSTANLRRSGFFPIPDHYYWPMFNDSHLRSPLNAERYLPGLDLNTSGQLALLSTLDFADELRAMRLEDEARDEADFSLNNVSYGRGGAEFLYSFIRRTKPRRIVEIGSGHSTRIARLALGRNQVEDGIAAVHTCIEPYRWRDIESLGVNLVKTRVEDCSLDLFRELEAGDLLFIDSTHMIRPQGDVLFEYMEIVPSLRSGVNIHVHDIFTPRDYKETWIRDHALMWNEQYILEALISDSGRYEVLAALNYLRHDYFDSLAAVCPYLTTKDEPGAFYFRIT